ncbi:MAG: hypothetical protein HC859_07200 [Bacteroidia bacterium]|nr:hypothetical protein [Bacteroidia bacterium]
MKKHLQPTLELGVILVFSALPLFFDLSYQINLYLTWEGAYRLYEGQTPYADFGIPMGFCYWIVPALFFKLFGPSLFTLAKAQFFINIVSGVAFRWLLMAFPLNATSRFAAILVYALSFILGLQWPQYNHSVIVYQIAGLAFLMHHLTGNQRPITRWVLLTLSAFFLVFSFFTKQDAGALGILIALILVGVNAWQQRSYIAAAAFLR